MAKRLEVLVQPDSALTHTMAGRQKLFARLKYNREFEVEEATEGAPPTMVIAGSRREELAVDGTGQIAVDDYAGGTEAVVQIETTQGGVLWSTGNFKPASAAVATAEVDVPHAVFEAAGNRSAPGIVAVLSRSGRFVRLDDAMHDFSSFRLYVAPILPAALDGAQNPQTAAVRKILGIAGTGELTEFETLRIEAIDPTAANTVALHSCTVHADGRFDVSVDITGNEVAWLWLLVGNDNYAGYQLEPVPTQARTNVVIMLPPSAERSSERPNGTSPSGATSLGTSTNGSSRDRLSMDFDESQLVNHPSQFSDDPGAFCSPFENPQRILSERRFFTVLRTDQPETGGRGSIKLSRPNILDLVPPVRRTVVSSAVDRLSDLEGVTLASMPRMNAVVSMASAASANARTVFNRDVMRPIRTKWAQRVREHSTGRMPVSEDNPIEWEGDPTIYQASSVAGGHVLEWRVQWRSNGYSLGEVAHTLTLAPRQTRRIAKVSWRRREEARRREATQVTDALTQVTRRERDYSDAVKASLSEWAEGGSESRTTGVAGGVGFALGPVVIGGGAAHGRASSSSWQQGGRRVSASEQQALRDAIRQYADSVRRLQSTVVTEVTQEEEVTGVSEVLRNVNYCHALTVLYYEILRHIRVDSSLSGVRECLFVPFSITPFDVEKALKWREQLRHGMLDRDLRWALDRLDEVATAWANSDIPSGRRSQHPIRYMTGSLYVSLSIERPREPNEDEDLEAYFASWTPFAHILNRPVRQIVEALRSQDERRRDAQFQRDVAPAMAAKWADHLQLLVGNTALNGVDFTLASRYSYGRSVRIDFTAPIDGDFNREQMQRIVVQTSQALPRGSVANLQRMTIEYVTDHFSRSISSDRGVRDLLRQEDGTPDPNGAVARFGLSPWEGQDMRRMIEDAVERLLVHLNANLVYYHKVIWWLMDRDELYMLLDGFIAPSGRRLEDGQWVEDTGRSLASVVERDPMAILGNTLVFRVAAGAFLGIDGHESPEALHNYYYDSQVRSEPLRVSLPTDGLYAQALMDECNACEEHQGSTDWVLAEQEPELEALADQMVSRRVAPSGLTPTELPNTIIALQNAPAAPDPSGLTGVLNTIASSDAFRDMARLSGTQANALGGLTQAASLSSGFGQMAVDFQKAKLGAADAKKKLDNIKKARADNLVDSAEAQRQASKVLDEQNTSGKAPRLTDEPSILDAIQGASKGRAPIEVQRHTKDGTESVKLGGAPSEPEVSPKATRISLLGSPAPGTNPGSTQPAATATIMAFAGRTTPLRFNVTRNQVATRLNQLVANPDDVNQGALNLCGPAAVLRAILRRDPKLVADFTIDLVETGKGRFGRRLVEPGADLRNQAFQPSWDSGAAEWVAMSSLRDDENWLFDFEGTPDETLSGATTPGEVEDWLRDTGLYSTVKEEANLVINEDKAHLMGLQVDNNTDNLLLIHAHLLRKASATNKKSDEFILRSFPNHWVVLAGPVSDAGGRVKFDVWSWGGIYTVDVSVATFEANYYGAVVARV